MDLDPQDDKRSAKANGKSQHNRAENIDWRVILYHNLGVILQHGLVYRNLSPIDESVSPPSEIYALHLGGEADKCVGTSSLSTDIDTVICHYCIRIQH